MTTTTLRQNQYCTECGSCERFVVSREVEVGSNTYVRTLPPLLSSPFIKAGLINLSCPSTPIYQNSALISPGLSLPSPLCNNPSAMSLPEVPRHIVDSGVPLILDAYITFKSALTPADVENFKELQVASNAVRLALV